MAIEHDFAKEKFETATSVCFLWDDGLAVTVRRFAIARFEAISISLYVIFQTGIA